MVTEYIKRNQKMGFDKNGVLLYKIPATEVVVAAPVEEVLPPVEETAPSEEI